MQQNEIYNIPLPRGPGPKTKHKKSNESGINYPGELKKNGEFLTGTQISTRNGSVIVQI
jgi:hypothetical protein